MQFKRVHENAVSTSHRPIEHNRKIYIFGSQQCVGLGAAIARSRTNTPYEKYGIVAETKPYAPCYEIIRNCRNIKLTPNDKLVLCVGENDSDLQLVLSQLQILLDIFIKIPLLS